ncbi:MAG: hypothetical protein ACTFAK_17150 [Candidatus Electronema sp. VV]
MKHVPGSIHPDIFCIVVCGCSGRQGQENCPRDKFSMNSSHETAWQADNPRQTDSGMPLRRRLNWLFASMAGIYPCCSRNTRLFSYLPEKKAAAVKAAVMTSAVLIVHCGSSRQPLEIKKSSHKQ